MGEHRLIVIELDYGSQSETLENCGMLNFERWQYQHTDYFGCLVLPLTYLFVQCEYFIQKLLLCLMCISFLVTCRDVNLYVQKIMSVPYHTNS